MSSREPPLQRRDVIPVQHHQTMLVVPSPVIVLQQDANARFPMSYGAVIRAGLMTQGRGGYAVGIGKLWTARSRLYRSRFLQPRPHFAAFFEIYQIIIPLHRSKFKKLQNFVENVCIFLKFLLTFAVFSRAGD